LAATYYPTASLSFCIASNSLVVTAFSLMASFKSSLEVINSAVLSPCLAFSCNSAKTASPRSAYYLPYSDIIPSASAPLNSLIASFIPSAIPTLGLTVLTIAANPFCHQVLVELLS